MRLYSWSFSLGGHTVSDLASAMGDAPPVQRSRRTLIWLAGGLVAASAFYVLWGAGATSGRIVELRLAKLLPMLVVGVSVALATVAFQTVTHNRILTPAIIGLDALYGLIQTAGMWAFGAAVVTGAHPIALFGIEAALLVGFALLLYGTVLGRLGRSPYLMVLVGIVLGTLFRSATMFLTRIIDPNEYLMVTDRLFASFSGVDGALALVAAGVTAVCAAMLWLRRADLDALALGRDTAISLGVDQKRLTLEVMALAAVMVACSTALVGPLTFLGLLVANLAYSVSPSARHAAVLPVAALLGAFTLVAAQGVLEHVLGMATVVSVVIEIVGGIVFLILLTRSRT